ncbi:MAG: glycosyltransferase family 39 protein [Chloroflexota bacterium]
MPRLTPNRLALLIVLVFLIQAVHYARVMPVFEAADEAAHFLYVHDLLSGRALPVITPRADLAGPPDEVWAIESHQPPLYYALGALLTLWSERGDLEANLRPNSVIFTLNTVQDNPNQWLHTPGGTGGDTRAAVWVIRMASALMGAGTIWLIYRSGRLFFDRAYPALLAAAFVAFIPTFISISASVNNDNLVTLLFTAGVFVLLNMLHRGHIRQVDTLILALILPAAALTKLTGAALYGVVFAGLVLGIWRGRFDRRAALTTAAAALVSGTVLAGWWYIRNWQLYGDPLALEATRALWGRQYEIAATSGDPLAELGRIWRSFWMMVGHLHFPVVGPGWVFVYGAVLVSAGIGGALLALRRMDTLRRDMAGLLLLVCVLLIALLLTGTRTVDISYGRLLYPALIGFALLLTYGWVYLARVVRVPAAVSLILLPLVAASIIGWSEMLPNAYSRLRPVDAPPTSAQPVEAAADGLTMAALRLHAPQVVPGDDVGFDLFIQGRSPLNPALFVTLVDPITLERLGHWERFPGIAPTDSLNPEQTYAAPVRVRLTTDAPLSPRQVGLRLEWFSPAAFEPLPLVDANGNRLDALIVPGPVLIDPRYQPPQPEIPLDMRFGNVIRLSGASITPEAARERAFQVDLNWRVERPADHEWTLTVQLLDANGVLVAQQDAAAAGYPSRVWVAGTAFRETRLLAVPADAPPGDYRIAVGWYRVTSDGFDRLTPADGANGLFLLPQTVRIGAV